MRDAPAFEKKETKLFLPFARDKEIEQNERNSFFFCRPRLAPLLFSLLSYATAENSQQNVYRTNVSFRPSKKRLVLVS